jgi:DNA-binding CsgD family transcriptional regulator
MFSKNKRTYKEIAKQFGCSALKVYALARGKRAKSDRDYDIIQLLIDKEIVAGCRTI